MPIQSVAAAMNLTSPSPSPSRPRAWAVSSPQDEEEARQ